MAPAHYTVLARLFRDSEPIRFPAQTGPILRPEEIRGRNITGGWELNMNTITKRLSAFGITGVAASALLVGGLAAPAQAAEPDRESNTDSSVEAVDAIGTGDNLDAARLGDVDLNILTDALTGNTVDAPVDAPAALPSTPRTMRLSTALAMSRTRSMAPWADSTWAPCPATNQSAWRHAPPDGGRQPRESSSIRRRSPRHDFSPLIGGCRAHTKSGII